MGGRWGAEAEVQHVTLPKTALLLESRSGKRALSSSPTSPYFHQRIPISRNCSGRATGNTTSEEMRPDRFWWQVA